MFPQFAFDPLFDLSVALMAFFGGLGTVAGPVLGALVLEPLQQYLTLQLTNGYLSEILLGALFLRRDLVPAARRDPDGSRDASAARRRQAAAAGPAARTARAPARGPPSGR